MLDDQQISVIEGACRRLLMRYATSVDRKAWNEVVTVFAEDAVWQRPEQPLLVGAAQIKGFFEALEEKRRTPEHPQGHRQRHLFTTISIEVVDENTARSIAYALVWRDETPPTEGPSAMRDAEVLVDYLDTFKRTEAGWRIAEHEVRHIFRIQDYAERLSPDETARVQAA